MTKCVAITGANGFIGQRLVQIFLEKKWRVQKIERSDFDLKAHANGVANSITRAIDETTAPQSTLISDSPELLAGIDVLIHCAYQKYSAEEQRARKINYYGTQKLLELAHKSGVQKIVYMSSLAAHKEAISEYGISKCEVETLFNLKKDIIVCPGLVIGKGGLYWQLRNYIRNHKFIPCIGGAKPIQTISLEELSLVVFNLVEGSLVGRFCVAEKKATCLRDFYFEIAIHSSQKKIFINIPIIVAKWILKLASVFRFITPVTDENLKGLEKMRFADTTDIEKILSFEISDFKKSISQAEKLESTQLAI